MWIEHATDIAQIIALILAGAFFAYKTYTGYFRVNLSLSVQCHRQRAANTDHDLLVISVKVKKGANGSLTLHDAQARVCDDGSIQVLSWY